MGLGLSVVVDMTCDMAPTRHDVNGGSPGRAYSTASGPLRHRGREIKADDWAWKGEGGVCWRQRKPSGGDHYQRPETSFLKLFVRESHAGDTTPMRPRTCITTLRGKAMRRSCAEIRSQVGTCTPDLPNRRDAPSGSSGQS
jgi:hypothetical protein